MVGLWYLFLLKETRNLWLYIETERLLILVQITLTVETVWDISIVFDN
jgi:hypothetical protein